MLRILNQTRRLRSDDQRVICLMGKIFLFLTLLLPPHAGATLSWSYHDFWGINGFGELPNLPPISLQIVKTGDSFELWFSSPHSASSNVVLQTTTDPASGEWQTTTNAPFSVPSSSPITFPAAEES